MKTIVFYSNQLCLRGSEIALYTYADYNEKILGNKSIICSLRSRDQSAYQKFADRFEVMLGDYFNAGDMTTMCRQRNVDYFYIIKEGTNDGYILPEIPTLVHAVFCKSDPHGHRYAYVSDWLAKRMGYNPETHSVPHIVEPLLDIKDDLRAELNIPSDALVFGYYGGSTEFNLTAAHIAVDRTVKQNKNIYFIFMNVNKFADSHPQIIHLPGTFDLVQKRKFINTCDAMLHARQHGETFGLAVAEFSMANKPVVTYKHSGEAHHIDVLGDRGIYYGTCEELIDILNNFKNYKKHDDYNKLYEKFSPEIIMEKFNKVFLS